MIIRAAILEKDTLFVGNEGERHHNIIHKIAAIYGKSFGEQGFINDKNQFLTREQAAKEALLCGQVKVGYANIKHKFDGKRLFSEDLW
jgi:hypothetical protein